jgi:D-amino-acid dehydrogenase
MTHVTILGAGITGVTTAYELLTRGCQVTIIDKNRYAAMETSFANGGQLSACNAEVWNSFGTIVKGMKWMFKKDAPLLLNPKPGWHKYSWLAEFTSNIGNYRKNTIATTRLAIAARQSLFDISAKENIQFDLERRGIMHVYPDATSFKKAEKVNALLAEGGLERRAVTPQEIRALEPALTEPYYGGFFTPSDSTGDIHKFTRGLADACIRLGATFLHDTEVTSIRTVPGGIETMFYVSNATNGSMLRSDAIVICAGVASRNFAAMLGERINIYPVKGYSITVPLEDAASQKAAPWVSLLDEAAKVVTSRFGADRLRVAGTAEYNGFNKDIRADRIKPLVEWTRHLFPGVATENIIPWAGLRPMMPDMMPRVFTGKQPGVYFNTGHGHLGWTLSTATAQMVAEQVISGSNAEHSIITPAPALKKTPEPAI